MKNQDFTDWVEKSHAWQMPAREEPLLDVHAKPFIKWLGGKRRLVKNIVQHLPETIKTYHEPFVGGGALFFYLAHRIVDAILSDTNTELMTTYRVVKKHPDHLVIRLMELADIYKDNNDFFYAVRAVHDHTDPIEIAARMIFLNKTCFNGIYRVNKEGRFTGSKGDDSRVKGGHHNKICIPSEIFNASKALQRATLLDGDFDDIVKPERGDFVYCDPPYDESYAKYQAGGFTKDDQIRLKNAADRWSMAGVNVMLSNSRTRNVKELYKDYRIEPLAVSYGINPKAQAVNGKTPESLIMSYPPAEE